MYFVTLLDVLVVDVTICTYILLHLFVIKTQVARDTY
jgi:hypothetical protein